MPANIAEIALADPRSAAARACLAAYYDELNRRLHGGFDVSLSRDPEADSMVPPRGAFFLATVAGTAVGCAGLKGLDGWGEVKRVWVSGAMRGQGLASRLMQAVEAAARDLALPVLRLDTNSALPEPVAMYRKLGWQAIARFNDDPYPDLFFEKQL